MLSFALYSLQNFAYLFIYLSRVPYSIYILSPLSSFHQFVLIVYVFMLENTSGLFFKCRANSPSSALCKNVDPPL